MIDQFLHTVFGTQWNVILIVGAVLLAASEAGFVMGRRIIRLKDDARKGQVGAVQGAILALLGLLLGFTFAMSSARNEARREFVLREATAIHNAYLRSSFLLPERQRTVEGLLRSYTDARLVLGDDHATLASLADAQQHSKQVQAELWSSAIAVSKETSTVSASTFITAVNEIINLDAVRLAALSAGIPGVVWLLLLFVASCGCYISGYSAGTSGVRGSLPNFLLPLLIAIVITLISDLHRPRGGLIRTTQQPMLEVKAAIQPRSP